MKLQTYSIKKHISLLILFLFLVVPTQQGCVPLFVAAAGSGYLLVDDKAREGVGSWLEGMNKGEIQAEGKNETSHTSPTVGGDHSITVEMDSFSVSPYKVKRGELVKVEIQYVVSGANKRGVLLQDRKDLWFDNELLLELDFKEVQRENGTWHSTISFKVPDSAQTGKYKIKQTLLAENSKLQTMGFFQVAE